MASMSKKKGSYYAKVSITNKVTKERSAEWIPLKTSNRTEALKKKASIASLPKPADSL